MLSITIKDTQGNPVDVGNLGRIIIYGHGEKLFDSGNRGGTPDAYEIKPGKSGEPKLNSLYRDFPVSFVLANPVKKARKENFNRSDNYTMSYSTYWEKENALYIHESEIGVVDLGEILASESDEEMNYLPAYKLFFEHGATFMRLHHEYIPCDGSWKIPDNGKWSDGYGTEESPCYHPYDWTNSRFAKSKEDKGVIKRWYTYEFVESAEVITAIGPYTKMVESPERLRRRAIADALNKSELYSSTKWSHYDIDRLEKALGYKLTMPVTVTTTDDRDGHHARATLTA